MFKVVNQSFGYAEWSVPYSDIFQEGGGGDTLGCKLHCYPKFEYNIISFVGPKALGNLKKI